MRRVAFVPVVLCSLVMGPAAFAQTAPPPKTAVKKDAVPAKAPAPPSPELIRARMRPPVKGTAYIEIIKGQSKREGNEIVTVTKVKNISTAPIVGLRVDEYWYAGQKEVASGFSRLRHALAPSEVVEITTRSEWKAGLTGSQLMFTQANGPVKPTSVKKFSEAKK
jgi:hypothetical protein